MALGTSLLPEVNGAPAEAMTPPLRLNAALKLGAGHLAAPPSCQAAKGEV